MHPKKSLLSGSRQKKIWVMPWKLPSERSDFIYCKHVKAGDADLQTWLMPSDGLEIPAYFVDVEYID
jgi:hypothetical protein